ncbi:hypothetical protein N0V94_007850 [Neodidymelliopsis sp. IMI 364377]|nr:hypothetical protein N0V94_007850 [Neodidymelliopsis sp. IMI 364377]
MFFCPNKEPRKKAKKTIDCGGILDKLPGFRTGHQSSQPRVGTLIQPATKSEANSRKDSIEITREVYFDPSTPIERTVLPIFIKHGSSWRRASANSVFEGQKRVLLSVSHVFLDDKTLAEVPSVDSHRDFDLGSGSENEDEDEIVEITSRASVSLAEDNSDATDSTSLESGSSTQMTGRVSESLDLGYDNEGSNPLDSLWVPNMRLQTTSTQHNNLEYLGYLTRYSPNLDWAVVDIISSKVNLALQDKTRSDAVVEQKHSDVDTRSVIVHTSNSSISGRVSGEAVYMRLPHSTTFEKVYQVDLRMALDWGDCGSVVTLAGASEPYGYIVASSPDKRIAYVTPAAKVLAESGTRWDSGGRAVDDLSSDCNNGDVAKKTILYDNSGVDQAMHSQEFASVSTGPSTEPRLHTESLGTPDHLRARSTQEYGETLDATHQPDLQEEQKWPAQSVLDDYVPANPGLHRLRTRSPFDSNVDLKWQERNLLSLAIGEEEKAAADRHNDELPPDASCRQTHVDSFWPQDFPSNVTHTVESNKVTHKPPRADQKFLPVHYFDLICGSSTGGLIAIMLGRLRMTVADCLDEYEIMSQQPQEAMEIWQVARAATAAPFYFKPLKLEDPKVPKRRRYFSDGGFGSENNPCYLGIRELQTLHGHDSHNNGGVGVVVSIGTARADRSSTSNNLSVNNVHEAFEYLKLKDYWRFDDNCGLHVKLDEWKPNGWFTSGNRSGSTTLATITNAFNAWATQIDNMKALKACASDLVARRRTRIHNSSRWARYAAGANRFQCKHPECVELCCNSRHEFNVHFEATHQGEPYASEFCEPMCTRWQHPPKKAS